MERGHPVRLANVPNMGIDRQDAVKVDLLTGKPQFPWRLLWRLGGEFLEVTCLATPDRRVLVLKRKKEPLILGTVYSNEADLSELLPPADQADLLVNIGLDRVNNAE